MDEIVLGAYATQQEADDAKAERQEAQSDLFVVLDGDAEHPWRIHWARPG